MLGLQAGATVLGFRIFYASSIQFDCVPNLSVQELLKIALVFNSLGYNDKTAVNIQIKVYVLTYFFIFLR